MDEQTVTQNIQFLLLIILLSGLTACQPATSPASSAATEPDPTPTAISQTDGGATSPLPTSAEADSPAQGAAQANCPGSDTEIVSGVQAALTAFQGTMASQAVADLRDRIACWLNTGGDLATLESALTEALTETQEQSRFTLRDLTGDGRDDVIALIPAMGLPLLAFVEQNGF